MNCQAHEVLGLAHQQRQAEARAQPAGEPDMVGMVMRDQNARERDVAEWVGEQRLPGGTRRRVVDASVNHRPAGIVLYQINVDVIEPERQRQPQPEQARCYLQRLSRRGWQRVRKA